MTIAAKEFSTTGLYRAVYFDGPSADLDREGEGGQCGTHPVWVVYVGDDEAEPTGAIYKCRNYAEADRLARRLAHDRGLDLIHEATPA